MRRALGTILIGLGVLLAAYPAFGVWQLGGDALAMVPDDERVIAEQTSPFAFLSDDFVVATRTYHNTTDADLVAELRQSGFTWFSGRPGADPWLVSGECCGSYDAALARPVANNDGTITVQFSAVDADIQGSWPFIVGLGLVLALGGAALGRRPHNLVSDPHAEPLVEV